MSYVFDEEVLDGGCAARENKLTVTDSTSSHYAIECEPLCCLLERAFSYDNVLVSMLLLVYV